jgi:hypothetical protein
VSWSTVPQAGDMEAKCRSSNQPEAMRRFPTGTSSAPPISSLFGDEAIQYARAPGERCPTGYSPHRPGRQSCLAEPQIMPTFPNIGANGGVHRLVVPFPAKTTGPDRGSM